MNVKINKNNTFILRSVIGINKLEIIKEFLLLQKFFKNKSL